MGLIHPAVLWLVLHPRPPSLPLLLLTASSSLPRPPFWFYSAAFHEGGKRIGRYHTLEHFRVSEFCLAERRVGYSCSEPPLRVKGYRGDGKKNRRGHRREATCSERANRCTQSTFGCCRSFFFFYFCAIPVLSLLPRCSLVLTTEI